MPYDSQVSAGPLVNTCPSLNALYVAANTSRTCMLQPMPANGNNAIGGSPTQCWLSATALLFVGFWLALWFLGRRFTSDSGVGIWTGAWTEHTSQWIADPYTFSHVLHGIFFYWLLLPLRPRLTVEYRFLIASLVEAGWEILENTSLIIDRYRAATASLDYYGDSILNSTFDLIAAMVGFWLAWKYHWKWVLLLVIAIELLSAYFIRDNLTLNIVMLFYPLESIKQWQLGS